MIDILTAAVFIICIWRGYKNGLFKSAYKVAAFILCIAVAYLAYPYVRDIISGSAFGDVIYSTIESRYVIPGLENGGLGDAALPQYMRSMVANGQLLLADALTGFISNLIINIIAFLLVFIVSGIIVSVIGKLVHIFSRLPVIRFFDRGLGLILGLLEAVLIIYIILALLFAVTPLRESVAADKYISESTLTKYMCENNPIVTLVSPTDYDNLTR